MIGVEASSTLPQAHLADAFATFIEAADRLERSHWQLHNEVGQLRAQLEERNRALAYSLAENDRMRVALRQILDALPCGVVVLEPGKEEIVLLNPEARRLLEISSDRVPGWMDIPAPVRTMLDPGRSQAWQQGDEHDFFFGVDGEKSRCVTVRYNTMADREIAGDSAPESNRVILTCRDTTTTKEAEREREASRNLVALAEVATVLAHEIRNPLGSLELLAGLLACDSHLSDDSKQCIEHLQAGIRSLSATVNNVLRFHSLGASNLQPTKLAEALRSALNFVQPLARQAGIRLMFQHTLGDTEIAADASELQQVILNLVCNALRHTPAGGLITISAGLETRAEQPCVFVEVADTGRGIRAEDLAHLFEPGFTTHRQSPGLGLTICQRIVEQHHGTIAAHSQPGKGATLHMEFPVL
jgi:signal transduction histidine kinase